MTRRPHITDHALLRYLERVVGIDMAVHRATMEAKTQEAVERGACALVSEGFRYAIRDQAIVTVKRKRNENARPESDRDEG